MPYARRYKRYSRPYVRSTRTKRPFARKRQFKRFRKNSPATSKWRVKGIPDQLFCKLNYVESLLLTQSGGLIARQSYQSSCFDPNQSLGGHQPRYWDQLTPLYNRYQVLGMKVKYLINNASSTPIRVVHTWTDGTQPSVLDVDSMSEQKYSTTRILGVQGGKDTSSITSYMSAKKIHGQRNILQMDNQQAFTSANPLDMFYSNIGIQAIGTGGITVGLQAHITFYVRMFEALQSSMS